jgi:LysM repeat protein
MGARVSADVLSWLRALMHPSPLPADERPERVVPFPTRGIGEPDPPPPAPRRGGRPRRARRRRQNAPWLQRNALSVAAVAVLVALLSVGFGLAQLLSRSEPTPAFLSVGAVDQTASTSATSAAGPSQNGPAAQAAVADAGPPAPAAEPSPRAIQANATVIQANYTVQAGDTLGKIAANFNTTVERIQAFNKLSDPRALRIGTKLVIPPPL